MGASHSWIILTMGDRPAEVSAAVASINEKADARLAEIEAERAAALGLMPA